MYVCMCVYVYIYIYIYIYIWFPTRAFNFSCYYPFTNNRDSIVFRSVCTHYHFSFLPLFQCSNKTMPIPTKIALIPVLCNHGNTRNTSHTFTHTRRQHQQRLASTLAKIYDHLQMPFPTCSVEARLAVLQARMTDRAICSVAVRKLEGRNA